MSFQFLRILLIDSYVFYAYLFLHARINIPVTNIPYFLLHL